MGGFRLFTLADVPVWISPWYIFLLLYMSRGNMQQGMLFALAITLSLLAHEMGHALMAKRFRLGPEILLHGFGGLTAHRPAERNRDDALIVAAGPGAGLLLAAVVFGIRSTVPIASPAVDEFLGILVWINVFWSLFNLLPMWPMDGGQLFRLGMLKLFNPVTAERITHITALVMILLFALGSYVMNYGMLMFFILALSAWQNVQALTQGSGQRVRRENPHAKELISAADAAFERGDDREAVRLCHQLRAENNLPPQVLARAWTILGIATTRKGDYEEALSYLKRAPEAPEVVEAKAQCFYQLDMFQELAELTETKPFERLPRDTREQILRALSEAPS
jgi:Zn-dependent protease